MNVWISSYFVSFRFIALRCSVVIVASCRLSRRISIHMNINPRQLINRSVHNKTTSHLLGYKHQHSAKLTSARVCERAQRLPRPSSHFGHGELNLGIEMQVRLRLGAWVYSHDVAPRMYNNNSQLRLDTTRPTKNFERM